MSCSARNSPAREPEYSPWGWALSTSSNLLLFMVIGGVAYMLYKQRRRRAAGDGCVPYRRVTVNQSTAGDARTRALVTGGSGSLGKVLVEHLIENGYEVHSLDLRIPEEEDRDPRVSSYIQADVTSVEDLIVAFKGIEVIFHTAALLPRLTVSDKDMYRVNATGTQHVITACIESGVKRLIYTSSTGAVATKKGFFSDPSGTTPPNCKNPVNSYAGSKAIAEDAVCKSNGKRGLATCALRPALILAPDNISMQTQRACYYDNGYDHVHVAPVAAVASAHLLAERKLRREGCDSVAGGKAYFIAGTRVSYRELVGKMEGSRTLWRQPAPLWVPLVLLRIAAYVNVAVYRVLGVSPFGESGMKLTPQTVTMMVDQNCDSSPACKELGWNMNFPPWEDMVKEVVEEMYGDQ